jgi:GxxExxY protein
MTSDELNMLTEQIIGCAFKVSNALGPGFLEEVYENALAHELRRLGLGLQQQAEVYVKYDGIVVGKYIPDLMVNGLVVIEVKATRDHHEAFEACCINYLTATKLPVCLLLNFGKSKLSVKRIVGEAFRSIDQRGAAIE